MNGVKLCVAEGDITKFNGSAIVNAANNKLLGGGGVDGAIHRAAGKELLIYCRDNIPEIRKDVRCETGECRVTPSFNISGVESIIHTVGPVYNASDNKIPYLLKMCYVNSLNSGEKRNMKSIAFPAISCGVYGYPNNDAMSIAFDACNKHESNTIEQIWFVLFGQDMYNLCNQIAVLNKFEQIASNSSQSKL